MKLIENIFTSNSEPLKFDSVLVITYGRSGSTLLQGILNSIKGVIVRGENNNMCFHMYQTYNAIMNSKSQSGNLSVYPFFGSEVLNEEDFLTHTQKTIKALLLGDDQHNDAIKCYGFKEIRYVENLEVFDDFLDFLNKVFPNVCFIFNTRKKEDVAKSWKHVKFNEFDKEEDIIKILEKTETVFFNYLKNHKENCFHISYEDVVGKTERLKSLYKFIGAKYKERTINRILTHRHSYNPKQEHVKNKRYKPPSA